MAVTIDPKKTGTSDEANPTFDSLTVTGATTIGGGLAVTGSISAGTLEIVGGIQSLASVTITKDGSDSISSGALMQVRNAGATRSWVQQLSASNNLDWWHLDGSWTKYMTLSTAGLAVTGSISATDNIINTRSGNSLITNETTVNGAHSEIVVKGPNSVGTARQANMGLNRFADDVWSLSNGTTEWLRVNLVSGGLAVTGSISATDYIAGAEQTPPSAPAANGYRIFAQDNGAGKTQLMVIFASGAAQQIAIEP